MHVLNIQEVNCVTIVKQKKTQSFFRILLSIVKLATWHTEIKPPVYKYYFTNSPVQYHCLNTKLMYTQRNFSYWNSGLPVTTVNEEHIFSSLMPVQDFELLGQQLSSDIWLLTRKWQSMLIPKLLTDMRKLDVHWNFIFLWRTGLYTVRCYWYTTWTLPYCISVQAVALTPCRLYHS